MALVSCAKVGEALTNWLVTASVVQKQALCAALNCGPTDEQIAAVFLDCDNQAHIPGNTIPTCEQMNAAIEEAIGNLGFNFADDGTVRVTGDGSEENPYKLDVKISSEEGNRLEVRDGMLGVFDTAPADLADLFISYVSGNDSNPGTRQAPLKTLTRATQLITEGSSGRGQFNLYFKSGEIHLVNERLFSLRNANVRLWYYDDPTFGDGRVTCSGSYPNLAASLVRPQIRFQEYYDADLNGTLWPFLQTNDLGLYGVSIQTPNELPTALGGPAHFILESFSVAEINGVDISVNAGRFIRPRSLVMQLCQLTMNAANNVRFADVSFNPAFNVNDSYTPGSYVEQCPGGPVIDYRSGNVQSVLTPANIGGNYDMATKTMFGYNTTWDIFE